MFWLCVAAVVAAVACVVAAVVACVSSVAACVVASATAWVELFVLLLSFWELLFFPLTTNKITTNTMAATAIRRAIITSFVSPPRFFFPGPPGYPPPMLGFHWLFRFILFQFCWELSGFQPGCWLFPGFQPDCELLGFQPFCEEFPEFLPDCWLFPVFHPPFWLLLLSLYPILSLLFNFLFIR